MDEPSHIDANLWLGSLQSLNPDIINRLNIEVIISVLTADEKESQAATPLPGQGPEIEVYDIQLLDSPTADLFLALNKLIVILDRVTPKRCLIHCLAGQSRSPSLIVGYLMYKDELSFTAALCQVKLSRPIIEPKREFLKQLLGDWPSYIAANRRVELDQIRGAELTEVGVLENFPTIRIYKSVRSYVDDTNSERSTDKIIYYLIGVDGKVITQTGVYPRQGHVLIYSVFTAPEHRRRGFARALLQLILKELPKSTLVFLEVNDTNIAAVNLYTSLGFVRKTERTMTLYTS